MAFRSVVEDGGDVSVETGLRAVEKLQAVHDKRDPGDDIADMRRQVNMILDAVKAVVPRGCLQFGITGRAAEPQTISRL